MIHVINALNLIDMESETHYSFRSGIPLDEYPQVHDFYEFTLVTKGKFHMEVGSHSYTAEEGDLFMIRPGVIHGKQAIPSVPSNHINLAFFASTMNALFDFLFSDTPEHKLPPERVLFRLTRNEKDYIQTEMEYLTLFPVTEREEKKTYLRQLLVKILYQVILPHDEKKTIVPQWFSRTLDDLKNQTMLQGGLPAIIQKTGLSEAYVCRTFKRYLNKTPTEYINTLRLNYAANMLTHSDMSIEEVASSIGISSLSYFYKQFKEQYRVNPAQFRKGNLQS